MRNWAVGMLLTGSTQLLVGKKLGRDIRTVRRWWARFNSTNDLQHLKGAERSKKLQTRSKIIIKNYLGKRNKSTRNLASQLSRIWNPVSKDTIHQYLTIDLNVRAYKRSKQPKLSTKQREQRIKFCLERKNWDIDAWRIVCW